MLRARDVEGIGRLLQTGVTPAGVRRVEVYELSERAADPRRGGGRLRAIDERDARGERSRWQPASRRGAPSIAHQSLASGSELVQAGALVIDPATRQPAGVVVASDQLTGELTIESQRIIAAYENYSQLRFLTRPLQGMYLSLFLMMTLMILVSATWMGLYLAKRITRPVQMLAAGAREIGAGHLDHRIEPETRDEFGSLVEAFNTMAGGAAPASAARTTRSISSGRTCSSTSGAGTSKRCSSASPPASSRSAPTGGSKPSTAPRCRLLERGSRRRSARRPSEVVRARGPPAAARRCCTRRTGRRPTRRRRRSRWPATGRELHLAAAATPLQGEEGVLAGAVLVFDDVTPLIRTQRVAAWRDVARRLAHEIKNPLTPIQLCAERMRRHFGTAPRRPRALVDECTATIVGEVESLKALVDEFAQFARMPAPTRGAGRSATTCSTDTLALYNGLFRDDPHRAAVRRRRCRRCALDVEQIRRVVINLVDNAVEALGGVGARRARRRSPPIVVETAARSPQRRRAHHRRRQRPGIPPADRESCSCRTTRPSGAAAASAWRSSAASSPSTAAASKWTDNEPTGTRFIDRAAGRERAPSRMKAIAFSSSTTKPACAAR